jgi:hypothetical protein
MPKNGKYNIDLNFRLDFNNFVTQVSTAAGSGGACTDSFFVTRLKFHQHFTRNIFIRNCFAQHFSNYSLAMNFFGKRILEHKLIVNRKMLMKLSTVQLDQSPLISAVQTRTSTVSHHLFASNLSKQIFSHVLCTVYILLTC